MRRILPFVLLLAGCRHVAISNDGRIASASRTGTYVAGSGRVAGGSEAIAWSPDGKALAISQEFGTLLWPQRRKISRLEPPYAWSESGQSLAGWNGKKVVEMNLENGTWRTPRLTFRTAPERMDRTSTGLLFASSPADGVKVEGLGPVGHPRSSLQSVAATPDGGLVWLDGLRLGAGKTLGEGLDLPIRRGRWMPGGRITLTSLGTSGDLIAPPSGEGLSVPTLTAFEPGGKRLAVAGILVEGSRETLARLRQANDQEQTRLLKILKTSAVVVLIEEDERRRELWRTPVDLNRDRIGVEDLTWSADGRWLAVGLADRTVRLTP